MVAEFAARRGTKYLRSPAQKQTSKQQQQQKNGVQQSLGRRAGIAAKRVFSFALVIEYVSKKLYGVAN